MTTFTLQDLNLPATADQAVETITKEKWMEYGMNNPISTSAIDYAQMGKDLANHELAHQQAQQARLDAVPPQPTCGQPVHTPSQVNPEAVIDEMLYTIKQSLLLLATVIKQQPNTTPPEGVQGSLQETVALVLQQSDWFKDMVHERAEELVDDKDFDYQIESAIETHFSNSFSLDDHVDISAEVESKVEDIAEDLLKDIVQEQLEEIVSNKLQNLRITFD
jgi:hypothetical protein